MFKREIEINLISLDEAVFKAAQFKISPKEKRLVGFAKRDVKDLPEADLEKAVESALAEVGIKRAHALIALPASAVITKNIEIPSLDPTEIRSIIDLQAGRHTPYPREEILVGYITIGVFQRNYTKVLLILVNRTVIKNQLSLLELFGVKVDKVVFSPEAVARFYAEKLNVKEQDAPVGVIDISSHATLFAVEFNKTLAMCRHIPVGMTHLIKEGAPAKDKLLAELAQSLEAYQAEDINKLPDSFILTGDDAKIKELQPDLQSRLKSNIKIMPYLDLITAPQPVVLRIVSEYSDDSFLGLAAVGGTHDKLQVDLTPEEIKTQRAIEEKGRQVVKAAILSVLILLLTCAIFFCKLYFKTVYLDRIKKEYVEKRKAALQLDRVDQRTRVVKAFVDSRMTSLDVIATIYSLIPDEIYLENVSLEESGTIDIQGVSESMSRVFNFVTALEESEYFKNVKTKSTTAKKDRGKDVAAFEITFRLESAKDEEPESSADEGKGKKDEKKGSKKKGKKDGAEDKAEGEEKAEKK